MGFKEGSEAECLSLDLDCYFPPGRRKTLDLPHVGIISILSTELASYSIASGKAPSIPKVQAAWALALQAYLSKPVASFAYLTSSDTDQIFVEENGKAFLETSKASMLRYSTMFGSEDSFCGPDRVETLARSDTESNRVNTAVHLDLRHRPKPDQEPASGINFNHRGDHHKFDLVLQFCKSPQKQAITLLYDLEKFSEAYACRIAETVQQILSELNFIKHSRKIESMSLLDKVSIEAWNVVLPPVASTCVHSMVSNRAMAIPDKEAIHAWDGSLTYSQLDELSSKVARYLLSAGVKHGDFVPFAFEKSLWTVVATLGILKAGAAFVPLDPSHPKARLAEILESTSSTHVVTSKSLKTLFQNLSPNVVSIHEGMDLSVINHDVTLPTVLPSQPVFALFTSGSTGKPKGMVHTHGGICTYFLTHGELMNYHDARVLQFSAYTFDAAILDIFTTLIFGGCVCVPSEDDRISDIEGVINKMGVDFALLTPSFASLITPENVPRMRNLCVAGESITQQVIERWAGRVRLMNGYGPAETGICFLKDVDLHTRPETIGYSLLNCSCWLVNPADPNRLVPVGGIGELVVAGPSLAREYLNDNAKTKQSFVTGLAWAKSYGLEDHVFFRTGDLLRYNVNAMDGSCDFIGRKDTQIKLHGQRIESGDVELRLMKLPEVNVAIILQPDKGCFAGELVAVLQLCSSKAPRFSNKALSVDLHSPLNPRLARSYMESHLPTYMVPTAYLPVQSMLINPSGKVDRKSTLGWVSSFETRPLTSNDGLERQSDLAPLGTQEITALMLSHKVAELVGRKDEAKSCSLRGHDFNLLDAGINSIQMIQLLMFLKTHTAYFPANKLWSSKTRIRDLACILDHGRLDANGNTSDEVDSLQEYRSYENKLSDGLLHIKPMAKSAKRSDILLTGACGFLGLRILQQLLAGSHRHVFILVRSKDSSEALSRVVIRATKQGWWSATYNSRLHVWLGDLNESDFGLSKEHRGILCNNNDSDACTIDTIIHSAANTHHNLGFDALKAANADSTFSLLRILARNPRLSHFVYVAGGTNPVVGKFDLDAQAKRADLSGGYAQTKFVAEALVRRCMTHTAFAGRSMHVVKPGFVISSVNGDEPNQTDFIWRLISACLELKTYDESDAQRWLFVSDVSYVAEQVASVSLDRRTPSSQPMTGVAAADLNILDGIQLSSVWSILRDEFHYPLAAVPGEQWRQMLESEILTKGESHVLYPFVHKLKSGDAMSIGDDRRPSENENVARRELRVKEALRWNIQRLIDVDFFHRPSPNSIETAASAAATAPMSLK